MNNDVDEVAKMASKFFNIAGWNEDIITHHEKIRVATIEPCEYVS